MNEASIMEDDVTRKEERRYTPEELAEKYQGSKVKFEPRYAKGKLETYLAASTERAACDFYKNQLIEQMDQLDKGKLNPAKDMEQVRQDCFMNGDARRVAVKESIVDAMVRDGYLVPRPTTLERQWQKRREAHFAERDSQPDSPSQPSQGRGGRG